MAVLVIITLTCTGKTTQYRGNNMGVVFLILGIMCIGIYAYTQLAANQKSHSLGVSTMKVFNDGKWIEEEEPQDQGLAKFDQTSLITLSTYGTTAPSTPGVVDGLKSKLGSSIQ